MIGILHGSSLSTCVPRNNQKIPGLFANLQHQDNLDFIEKWLPLGEYFALQNTSDTEMYYLENLDPHLRRQNLWRYYPNNDEVYSKVFFDICQDWQDWRSMNNTLDIYGVECSLYNSMVCANGKSHQENFDFFGVYCRKYI